MPKKNKNKPASQPAIATSASEVKKKQPVGIHLPDRTWLFIILALVAIVGYVVFVPSLSNEFTNWDDPGYLTQNYFIKDWSLKGLKPLFIPSEHGYIMGNYHPITMLSFAAEYHIAALKPFIYHRDSLILHILTSLAVTWFTWLISRNFSITALCGLLFVIHPMHVESVAWVAGRKDVLFGLFYFLALIAYFYYISAKTNKYLFYILVLGLFVLSLLSKAVAVTLPVSCLLIDYYLKRSFKIGLVLEKIPLFALSIFFGVMSIYAQKSSGAIQSVETYPILDRVYFASYGFLAYIGKLFVPVHLSNFYPYPAKTSGGDYDAIWYVYPFMVIALLAAIWYWGRKDKGIVFGFLFYATAIFLLLQLLPVGTAIMADRYSYIAYFGLFFMLGALYVNVTKSKKSWAGFLKPILPFLLVIWLLYLGTATRARCAVWKNTEILHKDQLKKQPEDARAYNDLGFELQNQGKYDEALEMYNKTIALEPGFVLAYANRGEVYRIQGKYDLALTDLNKAISLKPDDAGAHLARAIVYCLKPNLDSAGKDFDMAIKLDPNFAEAYCSRGNLDDMKNKPDAAMADYTKAITLKPDMDNAYLNRAALYLKLKQPDKAITDLDKYLQLKPESGQGYAKRSEAWAAKKEYKKALEDAKKAQSFGVAIDGKYVESLQKLSRP